MKRWAKCTSVALGRLSCLIVVLSASASWSTRLAAAAGTPPGTAITPRYMLRGDYGGGVAALSRVNYGGGVPDDPVLLLLSNGEISYRGTRTTLENRFDVSSIPPAGPFVQVVGSNTFGLARRADGTVAGWPVGTTGTAPPVGPFVDVACYGTGAAGVKSTGQLRIWGTYAFAMPPSDPGPYVDVEVSPMTVVARTPGGLLVQFDPSATAALPPTDAFVEHKLGGTGSNMLGIARRADGTLATWGGVSPPLSFRSRAYSRCQVGATMFGGIAQADGSIWLALGTTERRFDGPYIDLAFSQRGMYALRSDGHVIKHIALEPSTGSLTASLLIGDAGPRIDIAHYAKPVCIAEAGVAGRRAIFAQLEDGTVRLLEGIPWPGMSVGNDGVVLRDCLQLYPVGGSGSSGGAIIALRRDGTLLSYAAWPVAQGGAPAVPFNVPNGGFKRLLGEAVTGSQRRLLAIDQQDRLVSWDPTVAAPQASVELQSCSSGFGQFAGNTTASIVAGLSTGGAWSCFGSGDASLCAVPADVVREFVGVGGANDFPVHHGFGQASDGTLRHWGQTALASALPTGPLASYGVAMSGVRLVGASLLAGGGFASWNLATGATDPYTLNDPAFAANDIVQTMSQCTVRVGAGDCDGDGILDWDEIVAAGAGGDCNDNGLPDSCDIAAGAPDANGNGVLDSCEPPPAGDLNGDHAINAQDLAILLSAWGSPKPGAADLNGDGVVNAPDLAALLSAWTG